MAESGKRRSKLDWFKAIRDADLTSPEIHLMALLIGYSNAQGENAYPSVARLANDSGMSQRQVQRILRSLEAKRVIAVTLEGGNKTFKGAATVYRIMAMPKRPKGDTDDTLKGDTHDTLHKSVGGDKSGTKGDISDTKGDISGPRRVTPTSPHQVNRSGPLDQSDSFESASPASQPRADNWDNFENDDDYYDIESILENLEDELGFGPGEENMAEGMLQRGVHPNAVRNKINKQRRLDE